jgi:hypothetical protein
MAGALRRLTVARHAPRVTRGVRIAQIDGLGHLVQCPEERRLRLAAAAFELLRCASRQIDMLSALKDGDSNDATHAAPCCFTFRRRLLLRTEVRLSLTPPPRAVTVCPTASIFLAAFSSRSWVARHSLHAQVRVLRFS